jgi:hypothetical protein
MAHAVEKISIWILEALEEEWRREPNILKCRTCEVVLGEVMAKHGLENNEITRAINFMFVPPRQYLQIVERQDGKAVLPSENGLAILGKIALTRLEEQEKKKWSRGDKLALASFVLSAISFFAGIHVGEQATKKSASMPIVSQQTNSAAITSPKLP